MLNLPLAELKPAKNNVRQVKSDSEQMKQLVASIEAQGLLHNLVVMKNGKGYEVVDGNRRLAALRKIHGKTSEVEINCVEIDSNDQLAGLHANMMREDMHPLDQCDVISALCASGEHDFDSIAKQFGQTHKWVQQRVALADLSDNAKKRFRNCEFNIGVASALTLGSHSRQDEFLGRYEPDEKINMSHARMAMTSDKIKLDLALFDVKEHMADLHIEGDLFGEEQFITNVDLFKELQIKYVNDKAEEYRNMGYKEVHVLVDLQTFDDKRFRYLDQLYGDDEKLKAEKEMTIVAFSYDTFRHNLRVQMFTDPKDKSQAEIDAVESGEEPVLTPQDMSKPQLAAYNKMKAKHIRDWLLSNNKDDVLLAIACASAYHSYTHTQQNRPTNISYDVAEEFTSDYEPEGYQEHERHASYQELRNSVGQSYSDVDRPTVDYFIGNPLEWIAQHLAPVIARSIPSYVLNDPAIQKSIGYEPQADWFKPDVKWLNKYKAEQLADIWHNELGQTEPIEGKKALAQAISDYCCKELNTWDPLAPK